MQEEHGKSQLLGNSEKGTEEAVIIGVFLLILLAVLLHFDNATFSRSHTDKLDEQRIDNTTGEELIDSISL